MNTSTDRYRTLLVAAAAADNTTPPERHVSFGTRRLTLLVAAAALSITAAAAAATGFFTLADGSQASYIDLNCIQHSDGTFTLALASQGVVYEPVLVFPAAAVEREP